MFIIGGMHASDSVFATGAGQWVVYALNFAFALIYVSTWGIVGKIYASEIQPAKTRAAANSVAQGLNFVSRALDCEVIFILTSIDSFCWKFTNGVVALITPSKYIMFWVSPLPGASTKASVASITKRSLVEKAFSIPESQNQRLT